MDALKTILAAVDFGRASEAALAQAVRMAKWNRAKVHALHVVDTGVVIEAEEMLSILREQIQRSLEDEAKERWSRFAASRAGCEDCAFEVAVNNPRHAVLGLARSLSADLLVMGVRADDEGGKGPGPLAVACTENAPCPVLLTIEGQSAAFRCVVTGTDFSQTSIRALIAGGRVALQDGAALHVVHVVRPQALRALSAAKQAEAIASLRDRVEAECAKLGDVLGYLRPRIEVIEHASHGRGLVEYARNVNADLIALGTRGRTNMREVLLGSTAERVVRSAGRSVLTIPAV